MICLCLFTFVGCYAHTHLVGNGPEQGVKIQKRQWYALWGLVPINDIDTTDMAGNAKNYKIEREWAPLDILMNIFTGWVTIYSRTVTITK